MLPEEKKVGLIFAVIILLPTLVPLISGIVIKPEKEVSVDIPLCQVSNTVTIDVAKNEQEMYLNVPDYNASIFINMSKQYIVGDTAGINVKIQDSGIIKLSKPYFYLLVFDPSDKLKEMFPCFINEKEKVFSEQGYTEYTYNYIPEQGNVYNPFHPKWPKWVTPDIPVGYGLQPSCNDEYFYFLPNSCIYRQSLINGIIGSNQIEYTFTITKPGIWKIYVFLFDEDYKYRPNEKLLQNGNEIESFHNAVASGGYVFTANSEARPTEFTGIDMTKLVFALINAILAGIGYYGIGRKEFYPWLKEIYYKHIKKLKFEIIGLLVFLIIITIFDLLVFKLLI